MCFSAEQQLAFSNVLCISGGFVSSGMKDEILLEHASISRACACALFTHTMLHFCVSFAVVATL
jgi:hypothetical protein